MALNDPRSPMQVYAFADDIVRNLPRLERFARRLAGNKSLADDLVQDTVLRALLHADQFRPGTNLIAWLNAILRNAYRKDYRRQHLIDWLIFEEQLNASRLEYVPDSMSYYPIGSDNPPDSLQVIITPVAAKSEMVEADQTTRKE